MQVIGGLFPQLAGFYFLSWLNFSFPLMHKLSNNR